MGGGGGGEGPQHLPCREGEDLSTYHVGGGEDLSTYHVGGGGGRTSSLTM